MKPPRARRSAARRRRGSPLLEICFVLFIVAVLFLRYRLPPVAKQFQEEQIRKAGARTTGPLPKTARRLAMEQNRSLPWSYY